MGEEEPEDTLCPAAPTGLRVADPQPVDLTHRERQSEEPQGSVLPGPQPDRLGRECGPHTHTDGRQVVLPPGHCGGRAPPCEMSQVGSHRHICLSVCLALELATRRQVRTLSGNPGHCQAPCFCPDLSPALAHQGQTGTGPLPYPTARAQSSKAGRVGASLGPSVTATPFLHSTKPQEHTTPQDANPKVPFGQGQNALIIIRE